MTGRPAPWPCHRCGLPGYRNVGSRGYCVTHYEALVRTFKPETFALNGIGLTAGCLRPDYGEHYAELECIACAATWIGLPADPCPWCARRRANRDRWQAELVLTTPDVEPTDITRDARLQAWAERMARAVTAGLIDEREARAAWHREVIRAA